MKTLKKTEKSLKTHKKTNFRPKLSLCHFVIDPVKPNDKFIDIMGLDENYLICIFMNINKNVETLEEKKRENYGHCKVLDGLQDLSSSCIPEINSHGCQCSQRDHLKAIKHYIQFTHLRICMI